MKHFNMKEERNIQSDLSNQKLSIHIQRRYRARENKFFNGCLAHIGFGNLRMIPVGFIITLYILD